MDAYTVSITPMTNRPSIRLTYEDYCEIPSDGKRYQLVCGELFMTPAPSPRHQRIVGAIFAALRQHVQEHGIGEVFVAPVDVLLDDGTVLQPDVLFISAGRADIVTTKLVAGPPDLVVEVLSDGSRRLDEKTKLGAYEQHGVEECWYVDPEMDLVRIYRRSSGAFLPAVEFAADREDTLTSPLFHGLALPLRPLFA